MVLCFGGRHLGAGPGPGSCPSGDARVKKGAGGAVQGRAPTGTRSEAGRAFQSLEERPRRAPGYLEFWPSQAEPYAGWRGFRGGG